MTSNQMLGLIATAATVVSWVVTRYLRAHAPLDHPSARSSHTMPTPRGGGIGVVGATLGGLAVAVWAGLADRELGLAIGGGGLIVAMVGWQDDRRGVAPGTRLVAHVLGAAWAVWVLGGLPGLSLGETYVDLGPVGGVLAIVAIVWAVNLFNFMDGIDGLAGVEAIAVATGGAILLVRTEGVAALPLILLGAVAGFLPWNWAPARIFLGDVGSGFLGLVFGVLAVWSEKTGGPAALQWVVLGMVFVFDATVTLFRRAWRGERLFQAHRNHAYQRLVRSGRSHAAVCAGVICLNLVLIAISFLPPLPAMGLAVVVVAAAYGYVERLHPM